MDDDDDESIVSPLRAGDTIKKFENSKWPPFLGRGKFLKIAKSTFLDTLRVENFDEIALSRTVKEIEANLCFAIFGKNSKI